MELHLIFKDILLLLLLMVGFYFLSKQGHHEHFVQVSWGTCYLQEGHRRAHPPHAFTHSVPFHISLDSLPHCPSLLCQT